jgi:Golgi apyrase
MPPPVGTLSSTRYTIVVDAGSSGSRLIIYSYQDPEAERNEIVNSIRDRYKSKEYRKGKGKAQVEDEIRWEMENSLKRLVKVEKGAEGDNWMKKAEPGKRFFELQTSRKTSI